MENTEYRLCGGTFFVLLLQAVKQRTNARSRVAGKTDGLDDSSVLIGLFKTAFPSYKEPNKESFRTITSSFKSCQLSNSMYIPMTEQNLVDSFNSEINANNLTLSTEARYFRSKKQEPFFCILASCFYLSCLCQQVKRSLSC